MWDEAHALGLECVVRVAESEDLERALHFPSETSFQHLVIGHPWLVRAANYYYASAHLTGMVIFLVWLWLRHRDD